jgi:ATP-dependent RNA helicase MRH4, mitochondrial
MALSDTVDQPVKSNQTSQAAKRKSRNSPFGGMNQSQYSGSSTFVNKPSRSQTQRSSRFQRAAPKEKTVRSNEDTFHALKMQQALAKVSYSLRNTVKSRIKDVDSFTEFPLLPAVSEAIATQALPGLEEIIPTPVQRLAIPALMGTIKGRPNKESSSPFETFLLAAETGSGKTLAYSIPVIDAVKRLEAIDEEKRVEAELNEEQRRIDDPTYVKPPERSDVPHTTTARPKAIILLPSAELVEQITGVLKTLSHTVKFRAAGISAALTPTVIRKRLFSPNGIDILVATPHLLESITTSDPNVLSRVKYLVIDEADSLMDRSFSSITSTIIDKSSPSLKQLIMCSATIPRSLDNYLRSRFPEMRRLTTPNLHAIPRRVQLGVVDVVKEPYRGNKDLACANTIWTLGKSGGSEDAGQDLLTKRILVFVNEREKTNQLADYLRSKGIDAQALNRDTTGHRRGDVLEGFTSDKPEAPVPSTQEDDVLLPARRPGRMLPNVKVLVTTDLGSRGIDTVAVRQVILYDVPHSTVDFIHRLGRTGRMGRRGRGIVLVGKGDRRDVVKEVREGMFRGQALI